MRTHTLSSLAYIPKHRAQANVVMLGQNHHERILKEHLEASATQVEFGSELRSFTQSVDSVSAGETRPRKREASPHAVLTFG